MALFSQDELNSIKDQVENEKQQHNKVAADKKAIVEQFIDETTRTLELFMECMKEYPALAQAYGRKTIQLPYEKKGLFSSRQSEMLYKVFTNNKYGDQYYVTTKGILVSTKYHDSTSIKGYEYYDQIVPVKPSLIRQKLVGADAKDYEIDGKVIKISSSFVSLNDLGFAHLMASFTYECKRYDDFGATGTHINIEQPFTYEQRLEKIKSFMKTRASRP